LPVDRRHFLCAALAYAGLTGCGGGTKSWDPGVGRLDAVLRSKRVRVGYTALAPWAMRDLKSGTLIGWYADLARTVFAPVGVTVEFIETNWSVFAAGVQSGAFDFSIVPSYPTIQRATAVAFTDTISELANTALVPATSPFHNVFELNDARNRLVAIEGEQSVEFIRTNLPRAALKTFPGGDFNLLYSEVLNGRADAAFGYTDSVKGFVTNHAGVRDIDPGDPYSVLPICWATSYGSSDLRLFLNAAIAYLKGNGTVRALRLKYG
jgi:polar amino acid transport system substrate-binding protein